MPDRSLDEFLTGTDADADADPDADADADADAASAERTGEGSVDPTVPTMRWSGAGAACDACGATVVRRWRDGDAFVCADCKEWG